MNVTNTSTANVMAGTAAKTSDPQNTLGQDAFLKILVTQMKHQDPMEPLKDTEFIGQMAQFSSLEQLTNLNKTMTNFAAGSSNNQTLADHANLIGTSIDWSYEVDSQMETGQGIVKALSSKNGELTIELLDSDKKIPLTAINRIEMNTEIKNDHEIV
ncbi:flagellar hook capping FlgD N-terminal domain-containing protein [Planococcus halotolerans]|uniref:Flagellar hook assembly protein FlgD n=1 Tax=Planococcus halotolerans TaxID=2233542 RepID=A0A365KRT8_9BACL|nr:flagellar hook capping FlgD N-terminal domain-containing protein [Planococcus halotolerans]QHJ69562.1 flagellar hook assembly protein FlgD [Planococcus halotolerans]RAZ75512.1 flagellar hook assembly protein FlgD [Planococcus halotolerans]